MGIVGATRQWPRISINAPGSCLIPSTGEFLGIRKWKSRRQDTSGTFAAGTESASKNTARARTESLPLTVGIGPALAIRIVSSIGLQICIKRSKPASFLASRSCRWAKIIRREPGPVRRRRKLAWAIMILRWEDWWKQQPTAGSGNKWQFL